MDTLQEKHLDTKRGFQYRYYVSPVGDTTKLTLLLLHGWPDSALLWQYVVPYLTPLKLKILVPDLLGYGGTSKPTSPELYDYRRIAEDVSEILDAENIGKVIPIVHIGIAYMPPMPVMPDLDTLNAMTEQQHMESVWHALHGDPEDWIKYIFCTPFAMREWIEAGRTDVPLRPYAKESKLEEEWKAEKPTAGDWEATFCWYRAFTTGVQSEADKSIPVEKYKLEMPVLAIMCDGDGVNPPETLDGPKQAGLLPDLRQELLHSGHWCTYERPQELSRMIVEFVRGKIITE